MNPIEQAIEALQNMVDGKADYMLRNHLGNPYAEHSTKQALAALTALREAVKQEPVAWQFRWINPGNDESARQAEIEWKPVAPILWNQTLEQRIAELEAYRYDGKPCYEVRALGVLGTTPQAHKAEPVLLSDAWQPVSTAPDDTLLLVTWANEDGDTCHDFDHKEDGCWHKWHEYAEHVEIIGGHGVSYTPPYTHWMPLPPPPVEAEVIRRGGGQS